MLNLTGSSVEKNVLDQMDAQDPEVAEAVRNLMFTFADINKLTDRELQILLREVDQKDLVVALKAAEEELKDKILGNMSERVRTFITEEMEFLGPMRLERGGRGPAAHRPAGTPARGAGPGNDRPRRRRRRLRVSSSSEKPVRSAAPQPAYASADS